MADGIPPAELQHMLDHPHQSFAPQMIISTAICCTAALIAVVLRFVSRWVARVDIGKDDYAIVVALVFSFIYSFIMISLIPLGFGRHVVFLKPEDASPIGRRALVALVILSVATYAIKVSVLLLFRRLFPTHRFKLVLYGVGALVTAFFIASFLSTIFECLPVGAQLSGAPHTCINIDDEFNAFAFINSFFDFVLLSLPLPIIWRLHMSTKRKMQASAIFGMGLLACVSSLVRAIYTLMNSPTDSTYFDARTAAWVTVEINVSVVSACLPNLGPLVHRMLYGKQKQAPVYDYATSAGSGSATRSRNAPPSATATDPTSSEVELAPYETQETRTVTKAHSYADSRPLVGEPRKPTMQVPGSNGEALPL